MGRAERWGWMICLIGFAIGAFNHARDFAAWGWRPYNWGGPILEPFWTALLPLDVAVVALILIRRRRTALMLAVAIMVADVAANGFATWRFDLPALALSLPIQACFLGYLLGALPFLWRDRARDPSPLAGQR